jgi:hypothetical protein
MSRRYTYYKRPHRDTLCQGVITSVHGNLYVPWISLSLSLSLYLSLFVTHTHTCRWCFWWGRRRWRDCHDAHISDGVAWLFFGKRNRSTTVVQEKSHPASREDSDNLPANFRKLQNVRPFHLFKHDWFHVDEYRAIHFQNVSLHRLSISSVLNLCMLSTIFKGLQLNGRTLLTRWNFTLIFKSKFIENECGTVKTNTKELTPKNLQIYLLSSYFLPQMINWCKSTFKFEILQMPGLSWLEFIIHEILINVYMECECVFRPYFEPDEDAARTRTLDVGACLSQPASHF